MIRSTRFVAIFASTVFGVALLASTSFASILNGSFENYTPGPDANDADGAGRFVFRVGDAGAIINDWSLEGAGDVYLHISPAIGVAIGSNFNSAQIGNTYLD